MRTSRQTSTLGQLAQAGAGRRESLREVGKHLIGRGPLPVHDLVRQELCRVPQRLEQHRDRQGRRGGEHRTARVTGERPDPHHDADVDGPEHRRDQAVPDGAVDDEVRYEGSVTSISWILSEAVTGSSAGVDHTVAHPACRRHGRVGDDRASMFPRHVGTGGKPSATARRTEFTRLTLNTGLV